MDLRWRWRRYAVALCSPSLTGPRFLSSSCTAVTQGKGCQPSDSEKLPALGWYLYPLPTSRLTQDNNISLYFTTTVTVSFWMSLLSALVSPLQLWICRSFLSFSYLLLYASMDSPSLKTLSQANFCCHHCSCDSSMLELYALLKAWFRLQNKAAA